MLVLPLVFPAAKSPAGNHTLLQPPPAPPKGIYKFGDGSFVVFAEMDGRPYLIFPDGNIRGIRPVGESGTFEFGNAIAVFDTIQGQIQMDKKGEHITLKTPAGEKKGVKEKLQEQDKEFKNGEVKLSGALILPAGKGPFPCVVMTHGSGPESREASRGLAYLFAGHGAAAFIYDKRGITNPDEGNWKDSFDNYAADAVAAAQLVSKHKAVDPGRIGIFGHSQGGWIAPLAASRSNLFSFVIISAGNAVNPVEQHLYNGMCLNRERGVPEWAIKEIYEFRVIKYEAGITGNLEKYNAALPIAQEKPWFVRTGPGLPADTFWKSNGYYDPEPALSALKCPVLVIAGGMDKYSDTKRNMALFEQIFRRSGHQKVTLKVFPSANHAMLHTPTGKPDEIEMPGLKKFAEGYFETLTEWIRLR